MPLTLFLFIDRKKVIDLMTTGRINIALYDLILSPTYKALLKLMNIECMWTHDPEHQPKPRYNSDNEVSSLTDNQSRGKMHLFQWPVADGGWEVDIRENTYWGCKWMSAQKNV